MARLKTWLERIESLNEENHQLLLREAPRTGFRPPVPEELTFLAGRFVDLGFENLGLGQRHNDVLRAFSGTGVVVPGTNWRLRFVYPFAVVEPVDGSERETLPDDWKQAVLVVDDQCAPTWVGKRVRPNQTSGFNLLGYRDEGDGLVPTGVGPASAPTPYGPNSGHNDQP